LNNLGDPLKDVHTRMCMVAKTKKDCQWETSTHQRITDHREIL